MGSTESMPIASRSANLLEAHLLDHAIESLVTSLLVRPGHNVFSAGDLYLMDPTHTVGERTNREGAHNEFDIDL